MDEVMNTSAAGDRCNHKVVRRIKSLPSHPHKSILRLCIFLGVSALGCGFPKAGPVPGPVTSERAAAAATTWQGTTPESLAAGRETFATKCNKCHSHPDVNAISEEEWPSILDSMAKKAELTVKQKEDVLHFILSARTKGSPSNR
jgi:cytochrome c5